MSSARRDEGDSAAAATAPGVLLLLLCTLLLMMLMPMMWRPVAALLNDYILGCVLVIVWCVTCEESGDAVPSAVLLRFGIDIFYKVLRLPHEHAVLVAYKYLTSSCGCAGMKLDHHRAAVLCCFCYSQNLLVMRWANPLFGAWWNRHYVNNVQISFKEDFGTQVRSQRFDIARHCWCP
jgi:hypothetical protein